MEHTPKVSVIVPIYNQQQYLRRSLDSISRQIFTDYEVLLINDGSTDESAKICKEYLNSCNCFRYIEKINGGVASARQTGLDNALGEYIIHMDPDDWVEPNFLSELYNRAVVANADIVVCDYVVHNSAGIKKSIVCYDKFNTPKDYIRYNVRSTSWMLWNRIVRRQLIAENQVSFFDNINYTEDRLFLIRAYYCAKIISFVHIPLYHYNVDNSNSIVNSCALKSKLEQRIKGLELLEQWFVIRTDEFIDFFEKNKFWLKEDLYNIGEYERFRRLYPEINNKFLYSKNYEQSFIYRLLFFLASKRINFPFTILKAWSTFKHMFAKS